MELRQIELPKHLMDMTEIRIIDAVSDMLISDLEDAIEDVNDDMLIETSTEYGIRRREKILRITPYDTDDIESRRARVMARWYDVTPYTEMTIRAKMDKICGEGNYRMTLDKDNDVLNVQVTALTNEIRRAALDYLEETVMLQLVINVIGSTDVIEDTDLYTASMASVHGRAEVNLEVE